MPAALEPFRQIGRGQAGAHEGTGLGLPLAKMLVEKHGGTLTVTSLLGEGTTICIAMPGWRISRDRAPHALEAV
jgi:signal transduction histidine kinase